MKKLISTLAVALLMMTSATAIFAAEFTPSVEGRPTPEIVLPEDGSGNITEVLDEDGNVLAPVTPGDIEIKSSADADEISDPYSKANFEDAIAELEAADDITTLVPNFASILAQYADIDSSDDLVASSVINIDISDDIRASLMAADGNSITITLNLGIGANDTVIVLHRSDDGEWTALPKEDVKNLGNGNVSITSSEFSPFVFLTTAPIESPQTGVTTHTTEYLIAAALFMTVATVAFVIYKKVR